MSLPPPRAGCDHDHRHQAQHHAHRRRRHAIHVVQNRRHLAVARTIAGRSLRDARRGVACTDAMMSRHCARKNARSNADFVDTQYARADSVIRARIIRRDSFERFVKAKIPAETRTEDRASPA
jgi:hypothetical protein